MTLLSICNALAKNVGMQTTDIVVTSPAREWQEALQFANETGEELARRVDWGQLTETFTVVGTGTGEEIPLPSRMSRVIPGPAVKIGNAIARPLTRAEWNTVRQREGTPRYYLIEERTIRLFPYLALDAEARLFFQSMNWVMSASSGVSIAGFDSDLDTSLIDENLLAKGLIVRWRRQKGMDYADFEAEYESAIADFARNNDRSRLA